MPQKESEIQRAIVEFIRVTVPHSLVFAIPNGARRTASGKASNGVPGLFPGASDLVVLTDNRVIFAEVKSLTGTVRPEQRTFGNIVQAFGHHWCVWRGLDDVRNTFDALGVKTREVVHK